MTTTKKMTKREYFTILRAAYPADAANAEDVLAFIDHEIELLAKKNTSEKKPTKTQIENEGNKQIVLNTLAAFTDGKTISEIQAANEVLAEMSNQKVSALVRQMVQDGSLVRIEDKRKAYFKVA